MPKLFWCQFSNNKEPSNSHSTTSTPTSWCIATTVRRRLPLLLWSWLGITLLSRVCLLLWSWGAVLVLFGRAARWAVVSALRSRLPGLVSTSVLVLAVAAAAATTTAAVLGLCWLLTGRRCGRRCSRVGVSGVVVGRETLVLARSWSSLRRPPLCGSVGVVAVEEGHDKR